MTATRGLVRCSRSRACARSPGSRNYGIARSEPERPEARVDPGSQLEVDPSRAGDPGSTVISSASTMPNGERARTIASQICCSLSRTCSGRAARIHRTSPVMTEIAVLSIRQLHRPAGRLRLCSWRPEATEVRVDAEHQFALMEPVPVCRDPEPPD